LRRLNPDEAALWGKVMASVRPLHGATSVAPAKHEAAKSVPVSPAGPLPMLAPKATKPTKAAGSAPGTTLDGGWDRRISRGLVAPDAAIDLHGHTLSSAYALLDEGLERSIARGDRVLLLVTGKPPRPESERPHARGAIRAAVSDWLAASRHAGNIAAVRGAHPRHGGNGALYIVLRRPRG